MCIGNCDGTRIQGQFVNSSWVLADLTVLWLSQVKFTGFGDVEELPLQYMHTSIDDGTAFSAAATKTAATGTVKRKAPDANPAKNPVEIPEHLQIKPTDTDEEKVRAQHAKRITSLLISLHQ